MSTLPPGKTLRKVLLIAAIDGWSVVTVASVGALISLRIGSWIGVGVGTLLTAAGMIELHGRRRLICGNTSGITALVTAQLVILTVIVIYAVGNLLGYDEAALMAQITPEIEEALSRAQMSMHELKAMLKPIYFGLYFIVIGVTILFQGGLALYYRSRKPRIAEELRVSQSEPPPLP